MFNKIKPIGQPLVRSKSSDIYALGDDKILKLFHQHTPLEDVQSQALISDCVYQLGLPVPEIDVAVVEHADNGRLGLIYQRINGAPLLDQYMNKPHRIAHYSQQMAALHKEIHQHEGPLNVPTQERKLREKISKQNRLPKAQRLSILSMLEELPPGNQLCHGDLHPGNVIMSDTGPVILDWTDATRGNPLSDVARSSLIFSHNGNVTSWLYRICCKYANRCYLRAYRNLVDYDVEEFRCWLLVNAAARIRENIPDNEQDTLVGLIAHGLAA